MGQVRPSCAGGRGAADGMTSRARLRKKHLLPGLNLGCIARYRDGRPPLSISPGVECGGVFRNYEERHVGVLQSAELRALSAIDTGSIRADRQLVVTPRDEVLLAGKTRYPEGVDDVHALQRNANVASDRY